MGHSNRTTNSNTRTPPTSRTNTTYSLRTYTRTNNSRPAISSSVLDDCSRSLRGRENDLERIDFIYYGRLVDSNSPSGLDFYIANSVHKRRYNNRTLLTPQLKTRIPSLFHSNKPETDFQSVILRP